MSVVVPSLRAAIAVPPWVKNDLWRRARAVPSLDLRFADNKSLTDAVTGASLVTFTRSGNGTYTDSAGVLQTAATDVPRFDHNPTTGESLGLLVEEQRTNGIRNNTMVGAVAGTPGTNPNFWQYVTVQSNGLTASIVGTGVENGINYIDYRFNGTTVASPNTITFGIDSTTAATGQVWTNSTYWKVAGGTTTGVTAWQIGVIELTAVGGFVTGAFYTQTAPTSAALITQRPAATRTFSGGVTVGQAQMTLSIVVAGNTAIDFTLRIGLPQLEQGAFATSPILTSGAAATRNADVAQITGSAFSGWYRQDEGTMFAEGRAVNNGVIAVANDGSFDNRKPQFNLGALGSADANYVAAGSLVASFTQLSSVGISNRWATAYAVDNFGFSSNGLAPAQDSSGALPPGINALRLGSFQNGSSYANGPIKRLCFWPARLPNSTLQALSQ